MLDPYILYTDVHLVHAGPPKSLYKDLRCQAGLHGFSGALLQVGGIPAVLKYLIEKGLVDGSCITVTGNVQVAWLLADAGQVTVLRTHVCVAHQGQLLHMSYLSRCC